MLLLIDNFDSFTFNLVQIFQQMDTEPLVYRNNHFQLLELIHNPALKAVVISPGPGGPKDGGYCLQILSLLNPCIPVLGVCLGHQILAAHAGCAVVRAERIMHGKTSQISHDCRGIFSELPNPFPATRYHSLIVEPGPSNIKITAWSEYQEPMALIYEDRPWIGIQFHPESILTEQGTILLQNFLSNYVLGKTSLEIK